MPMLAMEIVMARAMVRSIVEKTMFPQWKHGYDSSEAL